LNTVCTTEEKLGAVDDGKTIQDIQIAFKQCNWAGSSGRVWEPLSRRKEFARKDAATSDADLW
jgi:hypothetical protein